MEDHDQRFKTLLREFFHELFLLFFPQEVRKMVLTTLEKARMEGKRALLQQLIEARFGALSEKAAARLAALSEDRLFHVGQKLLTAESLKELGLGK
jgi:hypothetical protein